MRNLVFATYFALLVSGFPHRHEFSGIGFSPSTKQCTKHFPCSTLIRYGYDYYVDFQIGNPPQSISLLLDTGSSDTWVSGPEVCHNCSFKTYNVSASKSKTLIENGTQFWEDYEPPATTIVTGFYVSDDFNIASAAVSNVSFAVVNSTGKDYPNPGGILAVGLDGFQTIAAQIGIPLPSLLDQMKAQEIIPSLSYGIYLGGQYFYDPAPGEITFGAYNPARFSGDLLALPLAPSPDQFARLQIWLSSVTVTLNGWTHVLQPNSANALGISISLDTGSPGSSIPNSMYNELAKMLDVDPKTSNIDCKYLFADGGLTYTFYGFEGKYADIWVPFKQIIKWTSPGECQFTIGPEFDCSRGDIPFSCTVLGSDFLRAAYIFVNYDNLTVSVAQADYEVPHSWPAGFEGDFSRTQAPLIVQ